MCIQPLDRKVHTLACTAPRTSPHPQLDRLTKLVARAADGSAPREHATLTGAVLQLGDNVPLVTSLLHVHAALLRMSVTAYAGGGSGGGGASVGASTADKGAFSMAVMAVQGLDVLLAFIIDTTVG